MSTTETNEKTESEMLRETFVGIKGREPKSAAELEEWLATDEGKAATAFLPSDGERWGEVGRS